MYNYFCNPNFCNMCCGKCIYVLGNGSAGKDGKAATISVGTVTSGNVPSVINSGTENAAVFDFVLVPGEKGNTGDAGNNGIDGKAATIKIGTVTSGSIPMVTNSGTENNAILDFVLVPGQQGIQGEQGIPGEPGSGLSSYGGGYNSKNQPLSFTAINTPIKISFDTAYPELNLSKTSNTFLIQESGMYEIIYNLDVLTNKSVNVSTFVDRNGVPITSSLNTQQLGTNQKNDALFSAALITKLSSGDVLDLSVSVDSLPNGLSMSISNYSNCSITIKKIG